MATEILLPKIGFSMNEGTLAEWLDHPVGHDVLLDVLRRNPDGDLTPFLDNPEQLRMIGSKGY